MNFANSTTLPSAALRGLFERYTAPFSHERLTVRVRYSRRSAFSGSCYYLDARLFINLGRRNRYPYTFATHVARARSVPGGWSRQAYYLTVADAGQLALFVYLHELYHYLVKAAGRGLRRREGMCDRFAVRRLVDHFACPLVDWQRRPVPRDAWDFQDLDAFVAAAPRQPPPILRPPPPTVPLPEPRDTAGRPIPVRIAGGGEPLVAATKPPARGTQQLFGFAL